MILLGPKISNDGSSTPGCDPFNECSPSTITAKKHLQSSISTEIYLLSIYVIYREVHTFFMKILSLVFFLGLRCMINLPCIRWAVVITFPLVLADVFLPYFPWQRYLSGQVPQSGNTKDQLLLF